MYSHKTVSLINMFERQTGNRLIQLTLSLCETERGRRRLRSRCPTSSLRPGTSSRAPVPGRPDRRRSRRRISRWASGLRWPCPRPVAPSSRRAWTYVRMDVRTYDTIRDAILTCARKPTQVGLIYRTEPTTKMCKKIEKLKSKSRYVRSNSKSLGNHVVSSEEEKERLQWEGFAEKEGFKSGMKVRVSKFQYTHSRSHAACNNTGFAFPAWKRRSGGTYSCTDTKKQTLSVQLCVTIRDAILACAQKPTLTHNN